MLQDDKQRYLALDSLRGICATLVVFITSRALPLSAPSLSLGTPSCSSISFFVLSGFVIASGYAEHIAAGLPIPKFILLRLGRLYPLHAVMLLAYVVVAAGMHFADPSYNVADFAVSALLFQVWADYVPPEMNHWNPPSWSISAEIWTYLVFAMVISTFQKRIAPLFVALITASLLFLVTSSNRYVAVCFSGGGFFRSTFGFSFGVLAYLAYRRWPMTFLQNSKITRATLTEMTSIAVCLGLVTVAGAGALSLVCPAVFCGAHPNLRGGTRDRQPRPPFRPNASNRSVLFDLHGSRVRSSTFRQSGRRTEPLFQNACCR